MFPPDERSPAGTAVLEAPESLAERAEWRLRTSPYLALRNVACQARGGVVFLRGHLPTYYLKQMAQALVSPLAGVERVVNEIEVATATPLTRRW